MFEIICDNFILMFELILTYWEHWDKDPTFKLGKIHEVGNTIFIYKKWHSEWLNGIKSGVRGKCDSVKFNHLSR